MTERLYYHEPYLTQFDATVTSLTVTADGRTAVTLDRTVFYPTSGGQPFDTGTLGGARVVDVIDADDGEVVHVIEGTVAAAARVTGRIDWPRRFDHMQQHTGQHILSAAFDRLFNVRTESFHLGADSATIDLAREVTAAEIERGEDAANAVVWEDRPVAVKFVTAAEAARLPLRKEPAREGTLRLIDVDGYDLSACGGTHVQRTGAIGMIAITGWERFRGGSRIAFACGGRALRAHRRLRDVTLATMRLLSANAEDLPAVVERLQNDTKEARRHLKAAQARIAAHEGRVLADAARDAVVVAAMEGWDQNGLKLVASAIAERPGFAAAIFGTPAPSPIVIARHPEAAVDCTAVLRATTAIFGGKGGGRPDLAQGGGLQGDPEAIADHLRKLLRAAL